MNDTLVLAITSIVVAIIGATATIISTYIGRENRKDLPKEKLVLPEGYELAKAPSKWKWDWRTLIVVVCIVIICASVFVILNSANSGNIEFSSLFRPHVLGPDLQWDAGSSEKSFYFVDGKTMKLTAGPHTWPNFPMVQYTPIIDGNFSVSVKMNFVPDAPVIKTAQMAGVLILPVNAHLVQGDDKFPDDWIAVSKNVTDSGSLVGCRGSWADYSSDTVFLRVERMNGAWRCAYSSNAENWSYLNVLVNSAQVQNQQFIVSLFAYSETDNALDVTFSDWKINYER